MHGEGVYTWNDGRGYSGNSAYFLGLCGCVCVCVCVWVECQIERCYEH